MFNMPGHKQRGGGHVNGGVQMNPTNPGNGNNAQQFNLSEFTAATNITRRDDPGEYNTKTEDGKITFIARPNNGNEQSWPVNSDAERNAVPQEFRDKLRMMDGANSGVRIQINPGPNGGGAPQPQPAPGGVNQKPAAPSKGRTTSA